MSVFDFVGDGGDGKPKWMRFPCQGKEHGECVIALRPHQKKLARCVVGVGRQSRQANNHPVNKLPWVLARVHPQRGVYRRMTNEEMHAKLKKIRHSWTLVRLLREFDLTYWQMQSALGYPIPSRIEARWPHEMNAGNPYGCGTCGARRAHPGLHVASYITHYRSTLFGTDLEDFERQLSSVAQIGYPCSPICAGYLRSEAAEAEVVRLRAALVPQRRM